MSSRTTTALLFQSTGVLTHTAAEKLSRLDVVGAALIIVGITLVSIFGPSSGSHGSADTTAGAAAGADHGSDHGASGGAGGGDDDALAAFKR